MSDEGQRPVEGVFNLLVDHFGGCEDALGLGQLAGYAGLLLAGQVFRDGAGHHASGQPPSLGVEFGNSVASGGKLRGGAALLAVKFGSQSLPDGFLQGFGQSDGAVIPLDGFFDIFGCEVGLGARRAALVAAEAEEVEVLALGVGQAQAAAALAAEHAALEVVVVPAPFLTGSAVGLHNLLYPVEQ